MKKCPEDYEDAGESYSNFDHTEPQGYEDKMRAGRFFCLHPAWEHHGTMWFEDGEFHEEVWRHGAHIDTLSAASLRELFDAVNEKWGDK